MKEVEVLTLQEAAAYLKISERTVYDWAQKGKIPCGKLGASWRFIKNDLQNWVVKNLVSEMPRERTSSLIQVLKPEDIYFVDFTDKNEVLDFLIKKMSCHEQVKNTAALRKAIYDREEMMSTGIGLSVGIPHVRIPSVASLNMVVAVCKQGIANYETLDSDVVKLVFMISANQSQHSDYIRILSILSKQVKHEFVREELINSETPEQFYLTLTGAETL